MLGGSEIRVQLVHFVMTEWKSYFTLSKCWKSPTQTTVNSLNCIFSTTQHKQFNLENLYLYTAKYKADIITSDKNIFHIYSLCK